MGGFISGICMTIILMQVIEVLGGTAGTGELPELLGHIQEESCRTDQFSFTNAWTHFAGYFTDSKRLLEISDGGVVLMAAGAVLTVVLPMEEWGNQDIGGSETRSAAVEDSGSGTASVEPGHHSEPFCGGRDHGKHCSLKIILLRRMDTVSMTIQEL